MKEHRLEHNKSSLLFSHGFSRVWLTVGFVGHIILFFLFLFTLMVVGVGEEGGRSSPNPKW